MKRPARALRAVPILAVVLGLFSAGCKPTTPDIDASLRAKLSAHREEQIQRLHAYAVAGQFPHNMTSPEAIHLFRDAEGRYCAVANLVHQDGRDDLVEATVREHNDLAIHDVHDGPMMTWILESGLTQEELERVQLPSGPMARAWMDQGRKKQAVPTPVDEIALKRDLRPPPARVDVLDEDAMKALVRAHVARMETELRANTDASLALAVARTHTKPAAARVASR